MKDLDVICPGCHKSYHTTTDEFNPYTHPNGSMVRLKDPWRSWGWCTFGDADNGLPPDMAETIRVYWSEMDCPGCGAPLAPGGELTVRNLDGSEWEIPDKRYYQRRYEDRHTNKPFLRQLESAFMPPETFTGDVPDEETRDEKIIRLREEGLSYAKIGEQVGLSGAMVGRIVTKETQANA